MNNRNSFTDKLNEVGKFISKKAKDGTDLTKLNMELKSKQNFIEKQYISIGRKVYEAERNNDESAFEEVFLIRQSFEEIEQIRSEIRDIKGLIKCPSCGQEISPKVQFCPNCGQEIAAHPKTHEAQAEADAFKKAAEETEEVEKEAEKKAGQAGEAYSQTQAAQDRADVFEKAANETEEAGKKADE